MENKNIFLKPKLFKDSFIFTSQEGVIVTQGEAARVRDPFLNVLKRHSDFQNSFSNAFAKAKQLGIKNPTLVGAIPFDTRKPSELFIPERIGMVSREALQNSETCTKCCLKKNQDTECIKKKYISDVKKALHLIDNESLSKLVLSRECGLLLPNELDREGLLGHMLSICPSGYPFLVPMSDGGDFVGMSPELLLSKQGDKIISHPFAASLPKDKFTQKQATETFLSCGKSLSEHKIVVNDIVERLSPYCESLDYSTTPSTVESHSLWHLATKITGKLKDSSFNSLQLASVIHPTPAVCGLSTDLAFQKIMEIESTPRDLFTGMVGWCDENGDGQWAVSIRCGILKDKEARLFAGAGIVKESDPLNEWQETETKLKPMITLLESSNIYAYE